MTPRRAAALLLASAAALSACSPGPLERQDPATLPKPPDILRAGPEIPLPWAVVRAGEASLALSLELPKGWRLHPRAPFHYLIAETKGTILFDPATRKGRPVRPRFPVRMRFRAAAGRYEAVVHASFHACRGEDPASCRAVLSFYRLPIEARDREGPREARVALPGEVGR